ncbi:uncharacterized protein J3D65DRAFT_679033 [Phyllosticta citribraziliensis]|uniref:SET domain-containing protein n=1 Tax=Phyllosticta citribraziliensis TaxID=989973 RepID=A0ABR1LFS1_9PEZI
MSDQPTGNATILGPALQLLEEALDLVVSGQVGRASINPGAVQTLREVLRYVAEDGHDVSRIALAVAIEGPEGQHHTDVLVALTPLDYEGDHDELFAPDAFIRESSQAPASPPEVTARPPESTADPPEVTVSLPDPRLPTIPSEPPSRGPPPEQPPSVPQQPPPGPEQPPRRGPPSVPEQPPSPSEDEVSVENEVTAEDEVVVEDEAAVEDSTDSEDGIISEPCRTMSNLERVTASRPRNPAHFGSGQYLSKPPPSDSKPLPTTPAALRNDQFYLSRWGIVEMLRHKAPFRYTNESRVDRTVWPDEDPRQQYTAEFYVCDVCYREQSEEPDARDDEMYCQCLSSIIFPKDSSVNIVEVEPSTLSVKALQCFRGGSIIAELIGLVTFGKDIEEYPRALNVCRREVIYQISQDSEGNWTRYLRYTTCDQCSNLELKFFTWKGAERVVVKVIDSCVVSRGEELMLAYV